MTVDATATSVSGINIKSSQNRLLIKNGRVVNDDGVEDSDVYIEDGIIKSGPGVIWSGSGEPPRLLHSHVAE
ncbi:hypothetical protein O3G_MSEX006664 [Manduca sexta]|uniref:Uncharacterized protein n=1 Tax=Manduca sexta TaxID=7130 RepID=A0A922CLN5_MANSE|nr:hypothetical protein O3G_MSEX006664 [Manduca sexta]